MQTDNMQTITSKYGVSERLQGMMYTEPFHAPPPTTTTLNPVKKAKRVSAQTIDVELDDVESKSAMTKKYQSASFKGLTFGQVTDQIWHFSSVDYGPRCT